MMPSTPRMVPRIAHSAKLSSHLLLAIRALSHDEGPAALHATKRWIGRIGPIPRRTTSIRKERFFMIQSLYDTVASMHEVRVESLEKLESREGRMLLSANAGSLSIVFPQEVWQDLLANASTPVKPTPEELEELDHLKEQLEGYADEEPFGSVLREVPCGGSGLRYDLVLRQANLFAMTTGYFFAPAVDAELVARIGAGLE